MPKPILSIIMPMFNSEKYVEEAIVSILAQSYTNFELIVVDDGSTDASFRIVQRINDSRIRLIKNEINRGIAFSRNKGMEQAVGKYIAPFDSDDVAMPHKFKLQIEFLEKHPEYGMIGSWALHIDEQGNLLATKWKLPAKPQSIPSNLLFRNYFVQSAVVIKREALRNTSYTLGYDLVEDHKMWLEIARNYPVWNFPDYLVKYRIYNKSSSRADIDYMVKQEYLMFNVLFKDFGLSITPDVFKYYMLIKDKQPVKTIQTLKNIEKLLIEIIEANKTFTCVDQKELIKVIALRWLKVYFKSGKLKFRVPVYPFIYKLTKYYFT